MADLFSPAMFDTEQCKIKTAGTGDAIDPKHIVVDPAADNLITNDPEDGLKVTADDFISAEEGNIAKKSQADGGILVKVADMVSDTECNALSVTNDGKLALIPEDLISDVMGGNPLGINPDDCKLYINPCLLPGPQNIVSKDEDNLIVEDPEDCSALLKYRHVVSEDAGNLIHPGSDGKLAVDMQSMVDRGYIGAGLVYVEKQDGSHVLQVAACDGLWFEEGTVEDAAGHAYQAKWLKVRLDDNQNVLFFHNEDGCVDCFTSCDSLSIDFSLNSSGNYLRILDHGGQVYSRIPLTNGLESLANGGITINTLDALGDRTSDLPISAKAIDGMIDKTGKGGLIWNGLNLLEVDFSKMPRDKIDSIMASLLIPIILEKNETFYVNINHPGAEDEFRTMYIDEHGLEQYTYYGRDRDHPWKTLSKATEILAAHYNLGKYTATLAVMPAILGSNDQYTGSVPLTGINRTTGSVVIRPYTKKDVDPTYEGADENAIVGRVTTTVSTTGGGVCFNHSGGEWDIEDFNTELNILPGVRTSPTYPGFVISTDATGQVLFRRSNFTFTDTYVHSTGSTRPTARLITSNGGHIRINAGGTWSGEKNGSTVHWLYVNDSGILHMGRSGNPDTTPQYHVYGSFSTFLSIMTQGIYRLIGTYNDPEFIDHNTTGKRYNAVSAGTAATGAGSVSAREVYFPGDTAGTMDLKYGSWVSPLGPDEGFAPIPHDDTTTVYGPGSSTKYGHVKLTDSLDDTDHCADSGVALSACAGAELKQLAGSLANRVYGFQIITGANYTADPVVFPSAGRWYCYLTSAQSNNLSSSVQGWEPVIVDTDSSGAVAANVFVQGQTSGSNESYRLLAFRVS